MTKSIASPSGCDLRYRQPNIPSLKGSSVKVSCLTQHDEVVISDMPGPKTSRFMQFDYRSEAKLSTSSNYNYTTFSCPLFTAYRTSHFDFRFYIDALFIPFGNISDICLVLSSTLSWDRASAYVVCYCIS